MTPDELRRMAGKVFAVLGNRRPVLVATTPYYRDPVLRWLVPGEREGDPLVDFQRRAPAPQQVSRGTPRKAPGITRRAPSAERSEPMPAGAMPRARAPRARRGTAVSGTPAARQSSAVPAVEAAAVAPSVLSRPDAPGPVAAPPSAGAPPPAPEQPPRASGPAAPAGGTVRLSATQRVADKSNELTASPRLLAGRDLRGTVTTMDALLTQRGLAAQIRRQGGTT